LQRNTRTHRQQFVSSEIRLLGLSVTMVSNNGPQFRWNEMEQFTKNNGIQHKSTAPHHPATNGQAESFVQIMLKKLNRLLMQYRKAPNYTTRQNPAELMFNDGNEREINCTLHKNYTF
jgi:transposase InsO family protein